MNIRDVSIIDGKMYIYSGDVEEEIVQEVDLGLMWLGTWHLMKVFTSYTVGKLFDATKFVFYDVAYKAICKTISWIWKSMQKQEKETVEQPVVGS